jgi:hypothetical protein
VDGKEKSFEDEKLEEYIKLCFVRLDKFDSDVEGVIKRQQKSFI